MTNLAILQHSFSLIISGKASLIKDFLPYYLALVTCNRIIHI